MEYWIIAAAIIIVYLIYRFIYYPRKMNKDIISLLNNFENEYKITKHKKDLYHYSLESNKQIYLLYFCSIPANSMVTINSRQTWSLTWGGNIKDKGRAYRKQRYLHELVRFLSQDFDFDKEYTKIIILYPDTENIVRYLNESDLDVVTAKDTPYGYKVTTFPRFIEDFNNFFRKDD